MADEPAPFLSRPRRIVVTGGAQGIGAAIVRRFAGDGHRVAIADVDAEAGAALAEALDCLFLRTDVARLDHNRTAMAEAARRFDGLDVVCLNAGVGGEGGLGEDFDAERYRYSMGVNLDGVVYGANSAVPYLKANGEGAIVVTSSVAGVLPSPDLYYSAAKHGLIGLARSLALVLYRDHITVNAICPGFVNTRLIAAGLDLLAGAGLAFAEPDHVAGAVMSVIDGGGTGQAWLVQTGPPTLIPPPEVELDRATPTPSGGTP